MVSEQIAGFTSELEGMEGGDEDLKMAGISYMQPN